jgi:hypothetical protein
VHAGDRARDDQPLDLAGALEDRVGIGVARRVPGQPFFPN